jgi:hypothetical protein
MMVDASSLFLRLASALVLVLTVLYQAVIEGWRALWLDDETWALVTHLRELGWGDLALPCAVGATASATITAIFWIMGMLCRTVSLLFAGVVAAALLFGGLGGIEATVAWLFLIPSIALVIQGGGTTGVDGFLRARRGKRGKRGKRGGNPYRMIGS